MPFEPTEEMIQQARALPPGLCDHCVGRRFAKVQQATNEERGRAIRAALAASGEAPASASPCPFCEDIFNDIEAIARAVVEKIGQREYSTFLVGSRQDPAIFELEQKLGYPENLKNEVNREMGKRLEALTGKHVDWDNPDLTILFDTRFASIELQVAPLYYYGRYRKFDRTIPQTRWPCRACRGKGCARCGGTGKMYQTSVEELVAGPLMKATGGTQHALHGMGREDIDARMLGNGRPFVVELENPQHRLLDLPVLEAAINSQAAGRIEIEGLRPSDLDEVRALKASRAVKTYLAEVSFDPPVPGEKLKLLETMFTGAQVQQRTPERVSHRRADLDRARKVLEFRVEGPNTFRITGEAGLYIKELVHGDGGRTRPSVQEALGVKCTVVSLDVIEMGGYGDGKGVEGLPGQDKAHVARKAEEEGPAAGHQLPQGVQDR
jgi:tRNA pseudouridine synthase 10